MTNAARTQPFATFVAPVEDVHLSSSAEMILEAAEFARRGNAALLGCGSCGEIPLRQLSRMFTRLDLVDLDLCALESVAATGVQAADSACRFLHADLTGLSRRLESKAHEIVAGSPNHLSCLDQLAALLDSATPDFWRSPTGERYDLVICSSLLTQLQAGIRRSLGNAFLARYAEQASLLSSQQRWRQAAWDFARRLEDQFVRHLSSLSSDQGIIYLSETVHVSWLVQSGPNEFRTEGAWIATRSSRLRDYLSLSEDVIAERYWNWFRKETEGPFWGRLYGVQALIYRVGE